MERYKVTILAIVVAVVLISLVINKQNKNDKIQNKIKVTSAQEIGYVRDMAGNVIPDVIYEDDPTHESYREYVSDGRFNTCDHE